jgi:aldose 1-epimerase
MYKIKEETFGKFTKLMLYSLDTEEYLSIIPLLGANTNELVLKKDGTLHKILAGETTPEKLRANAWHNGAHLLPYPNRIKNGSYIFNNQRYQLPINLVKQNHSIHGLLYCQEFHLTRTHTDEKTARVTLEYHYKKNEMGYPFSFSTSITYDLSDKGLMCSTHVANTGKKSLPLGDGWHPYFTFGSQIDALTLQLPSGEILEDDKHQIPTGNIIPFERFLQPTTIGKRELDSCFVLSINQSINRSKLIDHSQNLTIEIWQDTGLNKYNYLQVYIPPDRTSIALEPMTCPANAFNSGQDLIVLEPGECYYSRCGVILN